MPHHKPIKTYERKNRIELSNIKKSVDAVDDLFAKNKTKRLRSRRRRIEVKELPSRVEAYLTDTSLSIELDNTFDKLRKGINFNKVRITDGVKKVQSESESSSLKISNTYYSPIITRSRSKNTTASIIEVREKTSTLDKPVTSSLLIEKEKKSLEPSSLSYIKLPNRKLSMSNNDSSNRPIFSESFKEKQLIHSSTPCTIICKKKLVADAISPINSSKVIRKSIDWKLFCEPVVQVTRLQDFKGFCNDEVECSNGYWKNFTHSKSLFEELLSTNEIRGFSDEELKFSSNYKEDFQKSFSSVDTKKESFNFDKTHITVSDDSFQNEEESINHDHTYSSPRKTINGKPPDLVTKWDLTMSDIIETSVDNDQFILPKTPIKRRKSIVLKAGKTYRRSLALLRKSSFIVNDEDFESPKQPFRRKSIIVPIDKTLNRGSILQKYASGLGYVQEEDCYINNQLDEDIRKLSLDVDNNNKSGNRNKSEKSIVNALSNVPLTAKEIVLRRCGQTEVLPFAECYRSSSLQNCQKIGEGVYGEVFLYRNENGGTTVMKIIPIEGEHIINGEPQKKFDEILSEIVVTMELSNLRNTKENSTSGFAEVQKVRCIQGKYPDRLLDLWELYNETKGSENDSPEIFAHDQMYIVLELANGGTDLESFVLSNAKQAYSIIKQTALALAVAENELKFEHRDLHWGNILLTPVDKKKQVRFRLNGHDIEVNTFGIEVTIIDFTLSRIEYDGVVIYNDLSHDEELFTAEGDYQFEIYRLMQKSNGNKWQHFEPYTNILWLDYLLDKSLIALRYKNIGSKEHKEYLRQLKVLKEEILSYNSVFNFVSEKFCKIFY